MTINADHIRTLLNLARMTRAGLAADEAMDYASLDDPATPELYILDSDGYREGYRNWVMQQRDNEWRDK